MTRPASSVRCTTATSSTVGDASGYLKEVDLQQGETGTAVPQSALAMNSITGDNVVALSFSNDGLAPVGVAGGSFIEPISKSIVPIPSFPSLRQPPLTLSPVQIPKC